MGIKVTFDFESAAAAQQFLANLPAGGAQPRGLPAAAAQAGGDPAPQPAQADTSRADPTGGVGGPSVGNAIPQQAQAPQPAPAPAQTEQPSQQALIQAFQELGKAQGRDAIVNILSELGVSDVASIPAERYAEALEKAQAALQ